MKIYIAGPIRNRPNKNIDAFENAADWLRNLGYEPVNPFDLATDAEIDADETNVTPDMCRKFCRRDVEAILGCDGIYMLRGWEHSTGARAEHAVALWIQLPILYEVTA